MPRKGKKTKPEEPSDSEDEKSSDLGDEEPLDLDDEPPSIDPYLVLGLEKSATADDVKSAYRKSALKHHPDKAHADQKEQAHAKFQEVAFAYAILSDPIRRKRYDATGSTAQSISQDDDFSWADFYSSQFRDVVTDDAIAAFSKAYKGSDEEKDDVLKYYQMGKGDWERIYESVMLSNPLEDEDRFRGYIDEAIEQQDVKGFKAYLKEPERKKQQRMNSHKGEASEAVEYAKKLGIHDKLFGAGDKPNGNDGLAALIQKKQADRGTSFLDNLEAKYKGIEQQGKKKGKKGKRIDEDDDMGMPDEAAFQAAAARLKTPKEGANAGESNGRKAKRAKHS